MVSEKCLLASRRAKKTGVETMKDPNPYRSPMPDEVPQSSGTYQPSLNSQSRLLARYCFFVLLSCLMLPCLVIFIAFIADRLGIFIPCGPVWIPISIFLLAWTLMLIGSCLSDYSIAAIIGQAALAFFLLPCCTVLFTVLMIRVFGLCFTK